MGPSGWGSSSMSDLAFPKPQKRIKDARAIDSYRRTGKLCEGGCKKRPVHVHHIISRKSWRGGHDVPENLLNLDESCHRLWHTIGGKAWLRERAPFLSPDVVAKVRSALREEE